MWKNCLLIFVAEKRPVKPVLHMIVLSSLIKVIHYQPLAWFDLSTSAALTFLSVPSNSSGFHQPDTFLLSAAARVARNTAHASTCVCTEKQLHTQNLTQLWVMTAASRRVLKVPRETHKHQRLSAMTAHSPLSLTWPLRFCWLGSRKERRSRWWTHCASCWPACGHRASTTK